MNKIFMSNSKMMSDRELLYTLKEGKIRLSVLIVGSAVACSALIFTLTNLKYSHEISYIHTQSGKGISTTTIDTQQNIGTTTSDTTDHFLVSSSASSRTTTTFTDNRLPVNMAPLSVGRAIGISAGGGLSKLNINNLNRQLDEIVALGGTWIRFDIEWGLVQYSSPNKSTWDSYDTLINAISAHHLKGLGVIVFTPEWARDPSCSGGAKCPPRDPAQFATFAAQVTERYKGKGFHYWEIWNEPNSYDFWATKTDCVAYTAVLKATYTAIKKVDPQAVIVTGGLAPLATDNHNISRLDFLTCIYDNGGKGYFDAVGDHPYSYPKLPSEATNGAWAQMSVTPKSMRSIMIAHGDANKKIWITEFGVPTNGPDSYWYVSEDRQVQMVADTLGLYKTYLWAGPLFWYTLEDNGMSTNTNENFFGLIRHDKGLKPAYNALKSTISAGL